MGKLGNVESSTTVGDVEIRFESGKLAGQAGGAVVAHMGDTVMLVTSTASARPKEHLDFFPLTVDYEERMYAAGKIPGGFFKREGRPSEQAILTCRLIDRPMRPTFDDGLRNEIQILAMPLHADQVHTPDVLAINAASAATMLAGIPFEGPVAGLRMAMDREGRWTVFPTFPYLQEEAVFDLVVAGRLNPDSGEIDILMVEAEATRNAVPAIETGGVKPTEEVLGQALEDAKAHLRQLCDLQVEFAEKSGSRDTADYPLFPSYHEKVYGTVQAAVEDELRAVLSDGSIDKATRNERVTGLREKAVDAVFADAGDVEVTDEQLEGQAKNAFRSLEKHLIRQRVVNDGVRIDGRGPKDIRPLAAEVDVLPHAHGSGLFTRGETQVLNIVSLGMVRDAQRLDTINPEGDKRYIHHYNFLPFSTGETGFMRGPKRREIGHGALAERALLPVMPDFDSFPYTLRLVSEVLSSNGSTSMASVCASTLSLLDAGIPLTAAVGGIAMGLVAEDGNYVTLTDILGAEDAFGDMDFKVAGTREYITALQLDTKLSGIPADVLGSALGQAKEARDQILDVIAEAMPEPRAEMKPAAPRAMVEYIPADKIGDVIGPKGKIIREITDETGADIDVDDEDGRGIVRIYAADGIAAQAALDRVRAIANPVVPKEGERYYGTVVKTADFGAFVSLTPGSDGLLHISKLPKPGGKRLDHADEAVTVGDKMWVEVAEVREGRKFSLVLVEGPEGSGGGQAEPAKAKPEKADTTGPGADRQEKTAEAGRPPERREPSSAEGGGGATRTRVRERTRKRSDRDGEGAGESRERSGDDESDGGRRRRRRR